MGTPLPVLSGTHAHTHANANSVTHVVRPLAVEQAHSVSSVFTGLILPPHYAA